jgi:hypothetical protein
MKTSGLVVITLLALSCTFASAQTFGFESVGGGLFCNYEVLQQIAPYGIWQGEDVLSTCGAEVNATIAGVSANLTAAGNPAGFGIKGVNYADNIYDAFALGYTGAQWDVASNLACASGKHPKYGWIGFASVSGFVFGDDYGYLSCTIPGKGPAPTLGLSTGSAKAPARK